MLSISKHHHGLHIDSSKDKWRLENRPDVRSRTLVHVPMPQWRGDPNLVIEHGREATRNRLAPRYCATVEEYTQRAEAEAAAASHEKGVAIPKPASEPSVVHYAPDISMPNFSSNQQQNKQRLHSVDE